jgi:hypothetical protein
LIKVEDVDVGGQILEDVLAFIGDLCFHKIRRSTSARLKTAYQKYPS